MTSTRRHAGPGLVALLAALTMIGPFSIDTVYPAFASMGAQFGAGAAEMQQVTSVYLGSLAIASLFVGSLSDALGRRPVLLAGVAVFTAASLAAAFAPSLPALLACRVAQGLSAGTGIVARAAVRDLYEGAEAQRVMSRIAMIFGIAPGLAPIVGGLVLAVAPWPWVFGFLVVVGVGLLAWTWAGLAEPHPPADRTPFRPGALLRGLAEVLSDARFLRVAGASAVGFAGQFIYIAAAPIFVVDLLGLGEQDFGLFFVPMIAAMMTGSYLVGHAAGRISPERLVVIGFAVAGTAAALGLLLVLGGLPPLPWALVGPTLVAFGCALFYPVTQLAFIELFPRRRGAAASGGMFLGLVCNASLAGALAPIAAHSLPRLAATSLGLLVVGAGLWAWHLADTRRRPPAPA